MREILFRGFRPCDGPDTIVVDGEKVKGRWVEGYFVKADGRINNGKCFILENAADFSFGDGGNRIRIGCFIEVLPSTVGQYTGLTDKNGKKIFDGDVVRRETDYYGKHKVYDEPVVWEDDIEKGFLGEPYTSGYCIHGGNWEVIGSIHDGEGGNHA